MKEPIGLENLLRLEINDNFNNNLKETNHYKSFILIPLQFKYIHDFYQGDFLTDLFDNFLHNNDDFLLVELSENLSILLSMIDFNQIDD
jgi:hypothetical protein